MIFSLQVYTVEKGQPDAPVSLFHKSSHCTRLKLQYSNYRRNSMVNKDNNKNIET
jgi:hypothetical protein